MLGNQYRRVCLRTPTSAAISSSDTASTPRVPNRSSGRGEDAAPRGRRGRGPRSLPDGRHVLDCDVIAEALAGKRIAITGSTGFVGTALVERLLRSVPGCELVLLVRAGKRTPAAASGSQREIFKNDAFDRLRAELGRRRRDVRRDDGAADHDDRRRRRHRRARPDRRRPGRARVVRHRHPLGGGGVVRLAARLGRRDQPARPDAHRRSCCNELGVAPHLVAVSTCYVAGNRRGTAPEELVSDGPFDLGLDWRSRGRRRPPPARRRRGRQPPARPAASSSAPRPAPSSAPPARRRSPPRPSSCASGGSRDQLVEAGRARAASVGWPDAYAFTKALGEQALTDTKGDVPVSIVRPSIIESALAEPRPGWIRGFRMAEPVHHLLRPRPAAGVPRRARGDGRRDPGRHRRRRDHRRRRARARARRRRSPRSRRGGVNPLQVQDARRQRQRLVHRAPAVRHRGPADRRARVPLPRPRPGAGAADAGEGRDHQRREGAAGAAAAGQAGRPVGEAGDASGARSSGRSSTSSCTASTPSARRCTRSTTCWRCGTSSTTADQAAFAFDPRVVDWPTYISTIHLPSIVAARPGQDDARQDRRPTAPDRLRRQVLVPDRHVAAFDLENTLIASNVVESYSWLATRRLERARAAALRAAHAGRGARPARSSTAWTAATSCATSTGATRTRRSTQIETDAPGAADRS